MSDPRPALLVIDMQNDFITGKYRGIHEKGSGVVVSAVCYTIYTIYLSLCTKTAETTSLEPIS